MPKDTKLECESCGFGSSFEESWKYILLKTNIRQE